jgi:hypothetical protein
MRLVLRKIAVLLIAAGLVLSGVASHAHASMPAMDAGTAVAHESHQVDTYANLAIEAGEQDCLHASGDAPQPQNDSSCNKCCAACMSVSLMAIEASPAMILSQARATYAITRAALVAQTVATDPGIPKSL